MRYTVVFELEGPAAAAVAVEWTDVAAPIDSGMGWEPCHRLGGGRWRFASHDLGAARHGRDPGLFAGIGMRYRLTPDGPWSPVSASRKEIVIVDVIPVDLPPPALRAADWSALEPFELDEDIFTAIFTLRGAPSGAVAVDWTVAEVPGPADWTPCVALGTSLWRLDGPRSTAAPGAGLAGIGIRYRLDAERPASAVSEGRKAFNVPPILVPPFLLAAPVLAGAGKIGQPVSLDPGLWGGTPAPGLAIRWLRNGTEIPGATGMTFLPGPADDRTQLRARVAATSAAGSLARDTAALAITHVAPVAVGELFDEVFDQGTGPQELATAGAFAGAGLAFAVTGAGASIDAVTGLLSIPTDAAVDGAQVTVTATNSGGSATQSFLVTIEGEPALPELGAADWSVAEVVEDPANPGKFTAVLAMAGNGPAAAAAEIYWTDWVESYQEVPFPTVALGNRRWRMQAFQSGPTWHLRSPGETFRNLAVRYAIEPGGPTSGNSLDRKTWTVAQVEPPEGDLPRQPQSQVDDAIDKPLTDFGAYSGAGTNSGFFGSSAVVLAAASFAGNASADARLLQQLRYNLQGGHDPSGAGGFAAQHELRFVVAAALAKMTPRVWNQLQSAEKTKIDLLVKGLAAGAAYTSASNNFEIKANVNRIRSLTSKEVWWKGNPNFSIAAPGILLAARVFFGSAEALTSFLNGFDKAAFAAQLQANGLSNMYEAFRTNGGSGTMGARPTTAQVQDGIKNWTWARTGNSIGDHVALITRMTEYCFSKQVSAGLNNGAGVMVNGVARGRIINNAAGLPNKGAAGMAHELDTIDAEGKRSAMSYSMSGARIVLDTMTVLAAAGLIDPGSSAIAGVKNRMIVGFTDLKYKSDNGYRSYSHAGQSGPNEDWTAALRADQWGWSYTFGQWTHLLLPWLTAAIVVMAHPMGYVTQERMYEVAQRLDDNEQPQQGAEASFVSTANAALSFTADPQTSYDTTTTASVAASRNNWTKNAKPLYAAALYGRMYNSTPHLNKAVEIVEDWTNKAPIMAGSAHQGLHLSSHLLPAWSAGIDLLRGYAPFEAIYPFHRQWLYDEVMPCVRQIFVEKYAGTNHLLWEPDNWVDAGINASLQVGIAFDDDALVADALQKFANYFDHDYGDWRFMVRPWGPGGANVPVMVDDITRITDGQATGPSQYEGYGGSSLAAAAQAALHLGTNFFVMATSDGVDLKGVYRQWWRWTYKGDAFTWSGAAGLPIKIAATQHTNILETCYRNYGLAMGTDFLNDVEARRPLGPAVDGAFRNYFTTLLDGELLT